MNVAFVILMVALAASAVALAVAYVVVLRRHLAVVADELEKPILVAQADGLLARWNARLLGWKTVILAGIAGIAQVVPPVLDELLPSMAQLPWVEVVDHRVATWISIACTVMIPLVHATGMSHAAAAVPKDAA